MPILPKEFTPALGKNADFSADTSSSLFSPLRLVSSQSRFGEVANTFSMGRPATFIAFEKELALAEEE
jgi:hypothetical protein